MADVPLVSFVTRWHHTQCHVTCLYPYKLFEKPQNNVFASVTLENNFHFRSYDRFSSLSFLHWWDFWNCVLFLRVSAWPPSPLRSVGEWIPCPLSCSTRPMWESTLGMKTHWHKDASTAGLSHAPFLDTFNAQERSLKFTAAVCFNRTGWIEVSGSRASQQQMLQLANVSNLQSKGWNADLSGPWDTAYMLSEIFSCHNDSRYFHSCSELIHVKMKGNAFLCFSFVNVILQINQHRLCKNVSLWACCCMQGYSEWCVVYDYQTQMQFL